MTLSFHQQIARKQSFKATSPDKATKYTISDEITCSNGSCYRHHRLVITRYKGGFPIFHSVSSHPTYSEAVNTAYTFENYYGN